MLARTLIIYLALFTSAAHSYCPSGWSLYIHTERCVQAVAEKQSYFDALEYCEAAGAHNGGSLVSIHNSFQNAQLGSLGQELNLSCHYWIGLYDFDSSGTYMWTDGSSVDYLNWSPESPSPGQNASDPEETGAYMNPGLKNRWQASSELFEKWCFFCQQNSFQIPQTTSTVPKTTTLPVNDTLFCGEGWKYYNMWCYLISETRETFNDSESMCFDNGGSNLVSILSADEEKFVNNKFGDEPYWIGFEREDVNSDFYWLDGSDPNSYTNWAYPYPIALDSSNCAAANINWEGMWRNEYCGKKYYYACKKPATDRSA